MSEDEFGFYMTKSLNRIKPQLRNRFHCKSPNCEYFCELKDDKVVKVKCPKCKSMNCVLCQAIHKNKSCKQYQAKIESSDVGKNNKLIQVSCEYHISNREK